MQLQRIFTILDKPKTRAECNSAHTNAHRSQRPHQQTPQPHRGRLLLATAGRGAQGYRRRRRQEAQEPSAR